jgi:hypothetical protein
MRPMRPAKMRGRSGGPSGPPDGVRLDGRSGYSSPDGQSSHAPAKDRSLHDHYLWLMKRAERAHDARSLLRLSLDAEHDYILRLGRMDSAAKYRRRGDETDEQAGDRLVRDWEGWTADEAAPHFLVAPQLLSDARLWVCRARATRGRDPHSGCPIELDGRDSIIVAMRKAGKSWRVIETQTGIPRSTAQRRWAEINGSRVSRDT